MSYNRVILVGAGPGDAELLTVKALRALQAADIVVYDRLVSDEVMALIPRGVPKIYAGKSCKHKAMPQEEINQLLITLAGKYSRVVRLKGGDPFLFGRGGEEMLALRKEGIAYEIIPGITSAQGCASIAGIPLTHRGLASGVRFITGHRQEEMSSPRLRGELEGGDGSAESCSPAKHHPHHSAKDFASAKSKLRCLPRKRERKNSINNWQQLADPDTTLVVYMGLTNIADITQNLIAQGLPATTPAAIIERGTTPQERVFTTTLSHLPTMTLTQQVEPPSLVIIGKVAALAHQASAISSSRPCSWEERGVV